MTASASSAPPAPPLAQTVLAHGILGAGLHGALADQLDLRVGVGGEAVDGHDHRDAELAGVLDVLQQVGQALLQQLEVLLLVGLVQRLAGDDLGATAVHLEGADGGDDAPRSWGSGR